jgi:hypothetical protein
VTARPAAAAAGGRPAKREFTFTGRGQQARRVTLPRRSGYRIVFSRDGYLVVHRSDARQAAG